MTPEQFVFWLNGALEIMDPKQLDEKQIQIIKDHINLVLKKETPNRSILDFTIVDPSIQPGTIIFRCNQIPCSCGKCPSLRLNC